MKTLISIVLTFAFVWGLSACGLGTEVASSDVTSEASESTEEVVESTTEVVNPVQESNRDEFIQTAGDAALPEGTENVTYTKIVTEGESDLCQVDFTVNGQNYTYRVQPRGELELVDISGDYNTYTVEQDVTVDYCNGKLSFTEGEGGKIIWVDLVPGVFYSITVDTGATAEGLTDLANCLFVSLQGDN